MKLRPFNIDTDIGAVDEIWKEHYAKEFSLPDLTNAATFAVVEDKGVIVGFGIVKIYAEAIMVLDKDKSKRDKSETMKLLLDKAEADSKRAGIKQLHTFCSDEKFADLLTKHFKFNKIKTVGLLKEL